MISMNLNTLLMSFIGFFFASQHALSAGKCCRVNNIHPEFNCSDLTNVSEARCNAVWSGGVIGAGPCEWFERSCPSQQDLKYQCCKRVNRTHPTYNCNYWTAFGNPVGKNRCNAAYSGGIPHSGPCEWTYGRSCLQFD